MALGGECQQMRAREPRRRFQPVFRIIPPDTAETQRGRGILLLQNGAELSRDQLYICFLDVQQAANDVVLPAIRNSRNASQKWAPGVQTEFRNPVRPWD